MVYEYALERISISHRRFLIIFSSLFIVAVSVTLLTVISICLISMPLAISTTKVYEVHYSICDFIRISLFHLHKLLIVQSPPTYGTGTYSYLLYTVNLGLPFLYGALRYLAITTYCWFLMLLDVYQADKHILSRYVTNLASDKLICLSSITISPYSTLLGLTSVHLSERGISATPS